MRVLSSIAILVCGVAVSTATVAAGAPDAGAKRDPAAEIEHPIPEADIAILRLKERAVERLGIRTERVGRKAIPRTRLVGGIIETPPGGQVQVIAPQQGTVLPAGGALPLPGTFVREGDALLLLRGLSPAEVARARQVVEVATARLRIAEADLEREPDATGLLSERDAAAQALEAARRRLAILRGEAKPTTSDGLAPLAVMAPADAVVRRLDVTAGQAVPGGAPLLELLRVDDAWVRAPVYAGLLGEIATEAPARIRRLGDATGDGWLADSVAGAPTADPIAQTVDLYFRLPGRTAGLRPGERVVVALSLGSGAPQLVVSHAAVLYDPSGGAWVYESLGEGAFTRRRVWVEDVRDGFAVLARGPAVGTEVVTDGAPELFGTEFGTGK